MLDKMNGIVSFCMNFVSVTMIVLSIMANGQQVDTVVVLEEIDSCYTCNKVKLDSAYCDSLMAIRGSFDNCTPCYIKMYDCELSLIFEGDFYKTQPIGLYKEYYENGSVKMEGKYSSSLTENRKPIPNGRWYYINQKNKLVFAHEYDLRGELVGILIYSKKAKDWYVEEVRESYYWIEKNHRDDIMYNFQKKILLKLLMKSIKKNVIFAKNRGYL